MDFMFFFYLRIFLGEVTLHIRNSVLKKLSFYSKANILIYFLHFNSHNTYFCPLIIVFNQIHILTESKQHLRPRQAQFCVNLTKEQPGAKDASNKCFIFQ